VAAGVTGALVATGLFCGADVSGTAKVIVAVAGCATDSATVATVDVCGPADETDMLCADNVDAGGADTVGAVASLSESAPGALAAGASAFWPSKSAMEVDSVDESVGGVASTGSTASDSSSADFLGSSLGFGFFGSESSAPSASSATSASSAGSDDAEVDASDAASEGAFVDEDAESDDVESDVDDELDSEDDEFASSASATAGHPATAAPTPSATASAPTRPI
jgi:hypothetical protein